MREEKYLSIDERHRLIRRMHNEALARDPGLRGYMLSVYSYMGLGVLLTAAVSISVAANDRLLETVSSLSLLLLIALLGLGLLSGRIVTRSSMAVVQLCFWGYATLWGLLLAPLLPAFAEIDPLLIPRAFLITAATFAGMSLYSYTTRRNLGPLGSFLVMAALGLLVALLLNSLIFQDGLAGFLISTTVVLVFAFLTAAETQAIRKLYNARDSSGLRERKAIHGAFSLYGSFIVLFIHILNILSLSRM